MSHGLCISIRRQGQPLRIPASSLGTVGACDGMAQSAIQEAMASLTTLPWPSPTLPRSETFEKREWSGQCTEPGQCIRQLGVAEAGRVSSTRRPGDAETRWVVNKCKRCCSWREKREEAAGCVSFGLCLAYVPTTNIVVRMSCHCSAPPPISARKGTGIRGGCLSFLVLFERIIEDAV
jgi:hypothetical protein